MGRKAPAQPSLSDPPLDRRLASLAARQHGVVGLGQLEEIGLRPSTVRARVASGRLHRLHRGVYAVGHPRLTASGHRLAAVLACGVGASVSHGTAADQLAIARSATAAIHVSVPSRAGRSVPGLVVHRSRTLESDDIAPVDGVPTTSVARTLLDLADALPRGRLDRAIEASERLGLLDARDLERVLNRAFGRPAAARLRAALAAFSGPGPPARSELEHRALELFAAAGLPAPRVNALVETAEGPLEVDFSWPDRRLVVEADSYEFHRGRAAFERDRRRDQLLRAAGWTCIRVTWRQLHEAPHQVVEMIRLAPP